MRHLLGALLINSPVVSTLIPRGSELIRMMELFCQTTVDTLMLNRRTNDDEIAQLDRHSGAVTQTTSDE